ncbi:MAG: MBL fold metallo-hydrolase [Synergistaceae bacterium]|jgi:glyoxylase-like metal-dependent hydrolase (beta-lactamase superfamily II)|nr:MBL fold metallo-hydrolase [Synergistaceae bacterium]
MQIQRFQLGHIWTNCYVLSSGNGDAVIIDPGGPAGEVRDYIAKNSLRVTQILLTHGHGDHIMGLGEVRDLAADGVAIHRADSGCLTSASENLSMMMGHNVEFKPADSFLSDGLDMKIGGMNIHVIFTPGHTKGSCCFYATEEAGSLLISGDTLFARSVGRTDLPGGDEAELSASLKKLECLADGVPVYPGHGPSTTIGDERRLNPFWPR